MERNGNSRLSSRISHEEARPEELENVELNGTEKIKSFVRTFQIFDFVRLLSIDLANPKSRVVVGGLKGEAAAHQGN